MLLSVLTTRSLILLCLCSDDDALRFARAEKAVYETVLLRSIAGSSVDADELFELLHLDLPSTAKSTAQKDEPAGAAASEGGDSVTTEAAAAAASNESASAASADASASASAAAAAAAGAATETEAAPTTAPRDRSVLERRIAAFDQMARLMERHQKLDLAR